MQDPRDLIKELRLIKAELIQLNHTLDALKDSQIHVQEEKERIQIWGDKIEEWIGDLQRRNTNRK